MNKSYFNQKYFSIKPASLGQLGYLKSRIAKSRAMAVKLEAKFFRPYCVAYLDQLMLQLNSKETKYIYSTDAGLNIYLEQCGFKNLKPNCTKSEKHPQENIIKLKRFKNSKTLDVEIIKWLDEKVLQFIPNCSNRLKKKVKKSFFEIANNGLVHGQPIFGVSACGQFYPKMKYFEIAFYDAGFGLVNRVKEYNSGEAQFNSDSNCIQWAMKRGNSTISVPDAGLGLYLLREFIKVNQGAFQIIAGKGYFGNMETEDDQKHTLRNSIDGTLVNIRVNYSDNILYKLKGE